MRSKVEQKKTGSNKNDADDEWKETWGGEMTTGQETEKLVKKNKTKIGNCL
jgi:hypothetical protein